jgi:hypothetical protein
MSLFADESAMQEWLLEKFTNEIALSELIINYDEYKETGQPKSGHLAQQNIRESYRFCMASFEINELLFANQNISLNPQDILKPDFILYAAETQSIVIVKLKNLKGPTRQAGTEVGAYAAEIKSYLPFLADGEVINVIISTEWPALLRHYVVNEIIWLNRKMICLEPVEHEGEIWLRIIQPAQIVDGNLKFSISSQQLGGFHLCLYDYEGKSQGNYFRLDDYQNRIRTALNAMSAKGNALKTHGFAFLWRNIYEVGYAPYTITMVNYSSFQALPYSFLDPAYEPNDTAKRFLQLLRDHDPEGHGQMLTEICEAGEAFLKGFCDPRPEDFRDWSCLKPYIFQETDALAFVGWGLFEELFYERLAKDSDALDLDLRHDNPLVAISMLNEIIDERNLNVDWKKLGLDDEVDESFFE